MAGFKKGITKHCYTQNIKALGLMASEKIFYVIPIHCGESKTQRKWFLDEKRDGFVDENRVNNKENKNNRAVFMLYLFAYNIPMSK